MTKNENPEDTLIIYNKEQRFYVNVQENCIATIQQFEDSLILQRDIKEMAEGKIKELATKDIKQNI